MPNLHVNLNPEVHVSAGTESANVTVHDQDLVLQMVGGIPGPPGPAGGGAANAYIHDQATPTATWTITHNLGFNPNVIIIDSGGSTCFGTVTYPDLNTTQVAFSAGFSGKAYLS